MQIGTQMQNYIKSLLSEEIPKFVMIVTTKADLIWKMNSTVHSCVSCHMYLVEIFHMIYEISERYGN